MNKVILCGRLTADPDLRETQSGRHVCRFTVAVDRYSKNGDGDADFIRCIAFHDIGKNIKTYFSKGRRILIEGNIKTGSYDDKDGKKVYTTDVWVDRFEFVESQNSGNYSSEPPQRSEQKQKKNVDPNDFEELLGDNDLPF